MSAYPAQTTWPPQPNRAGDSSPGWLGHRREQSDSVSRQRRVLAGSLDPTYSGPYGLGGQQAWLTTVRPFRRTISAQAVARREVFQYSKRF